MKLTSRITYLFLFFTTLAFGVAGVVIWFATDVFIEDQLADRLERSSCRINSYLIPKMAQEGTDSIVSPHVKIFRMSGAPASLDSIHWDTVFQEEDQGHPELHRAISYYYQKAGGWYQVTIFKGYGDFVQMREQILEYLSFIFFALVLVMVLINLFVSKYLWKPFYKVLRQMRNFQLGEKKSVEKIATRTREFQELEGLFLEMADKLEGEFQNLKEYTENMAHEVQTPLAIIKGKTEALMGSNRLSQEDMAQVYAIYEETSHLSQLSATLNLLTKIENHEFQEVQSLATKPLIEKKMEAFRELINLKGLTLRLFLDDSHQILMDPFLFDILLKNLVKNAIRYSPEGGKVIIKSFPGVLSIANEGEPLNMAPDNLFKRFFKGGGNGNSLGLGLSIAKKICDQNNLKLEYHYENKTHHFMIVG